MFRAYITMIKGMFKFYGRTSRRYYILALLFHILLSCVILFFGIKYLKLGIIVILKIYGLFADFFFIFPMRVRRIHDIGHRARLYVAVYLLSSLFTIFRFPPIPIWNATALVCNIILFIYGVMCIFARSGFKGEQFGNYLGDDYGYFG